MVSMMLAVLAAAEALVAGAGFGVALLALWLVSTRRHLRRRGARSAEWDGAGHRSALWTSSARCPHCRSAGGVLGVHDQQLWFTCLACGQRHQRQTKA